MYVKWMLTPDACWEKTYNLHAPGTSKSKFNCSEFSELTGFVSYNSLA